jgi:NtrC-family two-component system sensor histidine kinase KinB
MDEQSRLRLLYDISHELNSHLGAPDMLQRVLELVSRTVAVEDGSLVALGPDGSVVEAWSMRDGKLKRIAPEVMEQIIQSGLAGWVVRHQQPALVHDATQDERWLELPAPASPKQGCAISVPMIRDGRVVGVLTLAHSVPHTFGEELLDLVVAIAEQATVALANTQLLTEIRLAEQRYESLFEYSVIPILITDEDGMVSDVNQQTSQFFGHPRGVLIGMSVADLYRMEGETSLALCLDRLRAGEPVSFQARAWTISGDERPVEVHAKCIERDGQRIIQWVNRDLSERLELERLRSDLISMVYHDLRGPLSTIINGLRLLEQKPDDLPTDAIETIANTGLHSAQFMTLLIDSLLDLQRLEQGQTPADVKPDDIGIIIDQAAAQLELRIREHGHHLVVNVPDDLPKTMLDSDMISRVILNLMENATKYMAEPGTLTVSAQAAEGAMLVCVSDTGPGIEPEDQARIFDKYVRGRRRGCAHGLGLGLTFCKIAVEAHGGCIWVESEPGRGATFCFDLPVAQAGNSSP